MNELKAIIFILAGLMVRLTAPAQTVIAEVANPGQDTSTTIDETYLNPNPNKGFTSILELGVVGGDGYRLKFNAIGSYFVVPWLSTGIGTGLRIFHKSNDRTVPLFADFRLYPGKDSSRIFFAAGAGASYDLNKGEHNPSLFLNFTVGTRVQFSHRSFINFSIGYEMQERYEFWGSYSHYKTGMHKLHGATANIGFSF